MLNSIGCPTCRAKYQEALRDFIRPNLDKYCETCKNRLDCKEEACKEMNQGAPVILDYLCPECKEHFENVKKRLTELGVDYEIDSSIVRGLDYYTKTVFEFVSQDEGYTVLGGGRYDGLVKELGGQDTPAVGFATGVERILEIYEKYNKENVVQPRKMDLYLATMGDKAELEATQLALALREKGLFVEVDVAGRSLKAQFKYADKKEAKYVLIMGEDEVSNKTAKLKNMQTSEEMEVALNPEEIYQKIQ